MAKRFTDTNKYKKPFIRSLQGAYKLLWDYLYHECDHAGIWIVDFEIAQIHLGSDSKINKSDALKFFNEGEIRVFEIDKNRWFLPGFIDFQYGELNPENRAHNSVIKVLKSFNLIDSDFNIKPLTSPLQGAKDKDMDKDMDKVKDKEYKNLEKKQIEKIKKQKKSESEFPEFQDCMAAYHEFYKSLTGVSPNIKVQDGKALKDLILHFRSIANEGQPIVDGFRYVFKNWQKLDAFYQKQIDLTRIYTNINSIISELKNKRKNVNSNTGNTDYEGTEFKRSVDEKIDRIYAQR